MSTEQNKAVARHFFAAQDQQKGALDQAICATNYSASIAGFPPMDRAGHDQFGALFYQAFPDIRHTIKTTVGEGDKVTVHFILQGVHTADFMGIPATGKAISVQAIAILEFVDGKVVQLNAVFDRMGLMQQLGVLP